MKRELRERVKAVKKETEKGRPPRKVAKRTGYSLAEVRKALRRLESRDGP